MTRRMGTILVAVAAAIAAGLWLWWPRWTPDVPPPPEHVEALDRTFALLVGCTEYPVLKSSWGAAYYDQKIRLRGPAEDVYLLASTLRDYLGVPDANMRLLVGWGDDESTRPTRANVLAALDGLANKVESGDRVIFQFAGHGTRQPDREGDESDGLDEVLLTADAAGIIGRSGGLPGAITDDEMHAKLRALVDAGATVLAFFDCCHSGTLSRDPTIRTREIEPEKLGLPTLPDTLPDTSAPEEANARDLKGIAAVYAARSYQRAPEMLLPKDSRAPDRRWHGLLTWHVVRAIQRHGAGLTVAELQALLVAAYRAQPYGSASPYAEGDLALRVARDGVSGTHPLQAMREDGELRLDGGTLRGIETGARIALYELGHLGEDDARLGTATVQLARTLDAVLAPATAADALPAGDGPFAAMVEAPGVPALRLYVDVAGLDAEAHRHLDPVLASPEGARFLAVAPEDASWRAWSTDGQVLLARREAGTAPVLSMSAAQLPAGLEQVLKAESMRELAEPGRLPPLPDGLRVELLWFDRRPDTDEDWEAGRAYEPDQDVPPGTWMGFRVRNSSPTPVDLALVGIDPAAGVTFLFPRNQASPRLEARAPTWTRVGPWPLADEPVGAEMALALAIPRPDAGAPYDFGALDRPSLATARAATTAAAATAEAWLGRWSSPGVTARGAPTSGELMAYAFRWQTTFAPWRLDPGLAATGEEVPPADHVPLRDVEKNAPPALGFVGGHDLFLPKTSLRAAAYVTWDDAAVQVHLDAAGTRGWAKMAAQARRAAAASGELGGDIVLRREATRDITFVGPIEDGRAQEILAATHAGPATRWIAQPGERWQARPSWATWPDLGVLRGGAQLDGPSVARAVALIQLASGRATVGSE
ncbi:MAG: caspase family protein [Planctomycetota bacterium]